ncbi:hypothetical protein [Burkholderia cenocepacia]|jgi:hypothetical protein|uniref:hypothetical protein n=1 Tax=Burkholderia cenocepacia TaxID=95486 RepID=UPI001390E490|nr:hypothetical protein [Burkholderia cenocepacia]QKT93874.1 hypothetical protein FOC42_23285 [Burkholderia cenocepacia]UXZ88418.1 hypothetical protein NUJ27_01555 [Burkholderia cenocepacia]HEF5181399.1 hypothetical protein [Burkholderia cenocepacia]
MIPPLKSFALAIHVMKTFARSVRTGRSAGSFIVLQGEFWPNGIYAGISEVAYAVQDLSVNRVGIFPTRRIERGFEKNGLQRGFGCETPDGRRTKRGRLAGKAAGNRIGKNYSAFSR